MDRWKFYSIFLILLFLSLFPGTIFDARAFSLFPEPADTYMALVGKISNEEYDATEAELFGIIEKENPKAALQRLEALSRKNPAVLNACHAIAHDMGHKAFEKYKDFGKMLKFQDDVCGAGYLHGIIEGFFKHTANAMDTLKTVCASKSLSGQSGRCYHAVGHGLMYYTQNDLPSSLGKCDSYPNAIAKRRCAEGVFMENFLADGKLHPSDYVKPDDPFYPCQFQKGFYKSICYFYAPIFHLSLHNNDYLAAMRWCNTAPAGYRYSCTDGLATRIMKQNLDDPKRVEKICTSGAKTQVNPCIDGMVSYYAVNYSSFEKTRDMCLLLKPAHQKTCLNSLGRRKYFFGA